MGDDSNKVCSDSVTKTISEILKEVSLIDDFSKKSSKLEFYVHALELEMTKIDAFKRELPHSMSLLKDAIERLKEEGLQWKGKDLEPVIDKKNWMSSAQLWSTPVHYGNYFDIRNQDSILHQKRTYNKEENGNGKEHIFVPFQKPCNGTVGEEKGMTISAHSLSLSISGNCRAQQQHQLQKKQRRCWSPELHKRFVSALHQLGGAQVATPKQIRELMNVDGLTNDEVKSHLQKYRLHIRKIPTSSTDLSSCSWLTQDQCKAIVAQSCSPQGPLHLGGSPKGLSATGRDSMEEEDDKSESHSWKGLLHKPVEEQQ
ncbi:transcription factor HHO5-like [Olea europaea subsp. europaea]|uniref:Transcription factor HHO5-like n=1 Tax=Olea europaea subsp. europaea TaxID=158383 RepID=A0A8S0SDH4_OLEEU|nr:transcription factor HHO5-like [Olea europaea subsp. europaea]